MTPPLPDPLPAASILDLPKEVLFEIFKKLSPWELVNLRQKYPPLQEAVNDFIQLPECLKAFLISNIKLRPGQAPDPHIEAYKESIANAITGVDDMYLKNNQQFLHGLQALELQQKGGFLCRVNSSFVWYKNHLWACGSNEDKQLGLGPNAPRIVSTFTRVTEPNTGQSPWGQAHILKVITGYYGTIVHTTQGLFMCGDNNFDQLGLGPNAPEYVFTFTRVVDPHTGQPPWGQAEILGVAAEQGQTAIHTNQGLFVCGSNEYQQLGLGPNAPEYVSTFTRVVDPHTGQPPWGDAAILTIALGDRHTVVHTTQGLFACGSNVCGQLSLDPDGPLTVSTFTRVANPNTGQPPWGDATILGVTAGDDEYTIIHTTQELFVCGSNFFKQLGLGRNALDCIHTFTRVTDPNTRRPPWGDAAILGVISEGFSTIVHTREGFFVCGYNGHGQLGLGPNAPEYVSTFTRVVDPNTGQPPWGDAAILTIALGVCHTTVHTTQGLFVCGKNNFDQLGLGRNALDCIHTFIRVGAPGQPPWGQAAILKVSVGTHHTTVHTTTGLFVCGDNTHGQLGLGPNAPRRVSTFTRVPSVGTLLYNCMKQQ